MELWIPSQSLEVGKISLNGFRTEDRYLLAPLEYHDGNLSLTNLTIMTPPLSVLNYDPITGKLQFDLNDYNHFNIKMNTLQRYVVGAIFLNQKNLFGQTATFMIDDIEKMIQYIVYKNKMTLYTGSNRILPLFELAADGGGAAVPAADRIVRPGDKIRCIINIKGISCTWNYNTGTPRLRFQHVLKAAYRV
jgi:hypothetical protein